MRIAAWVLTILAALACAWFVAVAALLIVPGGDDPYYKAAAARGSLLPVCLALANGIGALLLHRRRRPGALWIVLLAGLLLLAAALWQYQAMHAIIEMASGRRVPDYAEGFDASLQRWAFFRALLAWGALGLTITGWAAWLVNRRITHNLDRG